jgi:hypothetical protein
MAQRNTDVKKEAEKMLISESLVRSVCIACFNSQ